MTLEGVGFVPDTLSVRRGDTIVWVNKDPFPHTVTDTHGAFDSGSIGAGRSWRYTAAQSGRFAYVCTFHPNMKATLDVQ
ncbi:MAG TPA: plastocyanin/azurin family copper-binding protein [Casimicrobiaceae bacterium]|nr:plastocyanin/azurin family copper-binding protein [Casimicrobiaceae bacterium]